MKFLIKYVSHNEITVTPFNDENYKIGDEETFSNVIELAQFIGMRYAYKSNQTQSVKLEVTEITYEKTESLNTSEREQDLQVDEYFSWVDPDAA